MSTIASTTPGVDQTAIRDAAAVATRGWPAPGTDTRDVPGGWCGREDASGPGPAPKPGAWPSVTYRGAGQWVPLPPPTAVQAAVIDALGGGGC